MNQFPIKRAVISVWDKTGIVPLAHLLTDHGVEIFSTGGTFRMLTENGINVKRIEDLTGFPEILGGRVKTLHPVVFAGLLADVRLAEHQNDLSRTGIEPFQLVIVNLYPFVETLQSGDKNDAEIIEMIDIGGPGMLRAASKNYANVVILSDPGQYAEFSEKYQAQTITPEYRRTLAQAVFLKTAAYDAEIANFLGGQDPDLPEIMVCPLRLQQALRYGENPDQRAGLYRPATTAGWEPFRQLQGKEISFNNYIDCLAAYKITATCPSDIPTAVVIKHTNPCGFAVGQTALNAYRRAVLTDPVSYFGGIVGVNCPVDAALAEELVKSFLECIVAPEYTSSALTMLSKKKNLRLLVPNPANLAENLDIRGYGSGALVQTVQSSPDDESAWQVVTQVAPKTEHYPAMRLGWHLVKYVKSNAIVLCNAEGTLGVGAGQMSRIDSVRIAINKAHAAGLELKGAVMASDAFFPFADSVEEAARQGISGVIQPGGSIRDQDSIEACNRLGLFMLFTGKRVFKH